LVPYEFDFMSERVDISWHHRFLPRVGVEVAVGAAMGAKGDVEVKGKRGGRHEEEIVIGH
jgi:hypothetical protein